MLKRHSYSIIFYISFYFVGLLLVIINQLCNNYFEYLKQGVDDFVEYLVVEQVHEPTKKKRMIQKAKKIFTVPRHNA